MHRTHMRLPVCTHAEETRSVQVRYNVTLQESGIQQQYERLVADMVAQQKALLSKHAAIERKLKEADVRTLFSLMCL